MSCGVNICSLSVENTRLGSMLFQTYLRVQCCSRWLPHNIHSAVRMFKKDKSEFDLQEPHKEVRTWVKWEHDCSHCSHVITVGDPKL